MEAKKEAAAPANEAIPATTVMLSLKSLKARGIAIASKQSKAARTMSVKYDD
jgi:hypothetical protein